MIRIVHVQRQTYAKSKLSTCNIDSPTVESFRPESVLIQLDMAGTMVSGCDTAADNG
jgi:hypothetical protein